jgi:hypothetical protein
MTPREKIVACLERCVAGIIHKDGIFRESKSYVTLLPHICGETVVNQTLEEGFKLYDILKEDWITIPASRLKEIKWESTKVYPDEILNIELTDEYLKEQSDFRDIIVNMVITEVADEVSRYDDYTEYDLMMELYTSTGIRPAYETRDDLMKLINQLLVIQTTHFINYDEVAAYIGEVPVSFDANTLCGDRYKAMIDMTDRAVISNAWDNMKEIIDWQISLSIRDLEQERSEVTDEEEIEEINIAIELVSGAIDGVDQSNFKNVYDVGKFWPTLLYPPPEFALSVC